MLSEKILKEVLKKNKLVTPEKLKTLQAKAKKKNKELEEYLLEKELVKEADLYKKAGQHLDFPYVELKNREIKREVINLIPGPVAGTHHVVAFDKDKDQVHLAMTDPTNIQIIEFLHRKTGLNPKVFITSPSELKFAMRQYHGQLEEDLQVIDEVSDSADDKELKKAAEELPIVNIVDTVLEHAVYENASDIHIEPAEKEVIVRYRIDGILKQVMTLPKTVQSGLIARIKILSNLKIDEHMLPQDGRFKIQLNGDKLAFRVSIIPVYDGEKTVMRILHEGAKPLSLDQLGFLPEPKKILEVAITKPHGMILVTGPTGSGKTTTLYSVLGMLNKPGVNICTVEDPIEYRLAGINQSQINSKVGFTFAAGLRSFLRQDPDVIMVGEIRDQETAEIAIHAAMTGHLVLSTLHTNDAPTTLPRLMDMGVPPFLVAYTTNVVIGQRLVRKICEHCRKTYQLDKEATEELGRVFDVSKLPQLFRNNLGADAGKGGKFTFYKGEGCKRCGETGYKGRVGIYEVLEIDDDLIKKITARATADEIKVHARQKGMVTILEDGLLKARQGVTTISEILRVTKE